MNRLRLAQFDPRARLAIAASACAAAALPAASLSVVLVPLLAMLLLGGQAPLLARTARRLAAPLALLFALDWIIVGPVPAAVITLRVLALALSFLVVVDPASFTQTFQTLRWLRVPRNAALSLVFGLGSIGMLDRQWRAVKEAQRARGIAVPGRVRGPRGFVRAVGSSVPLVVPAVVLAVKQAWQATESAHLRGVDRPMRGLPEGVLRLRGRDAALLGGWACLLSLAVWIGTL